MFTAVWGPERWAVEMLWVAKVRHQRCFGILEGGWQGQEILSAGKTVIPTLLENHWAVLAEIALNH